MTLEGDEKGGTVHQADVAGVIAPPPVMFGIGLLASLGLEILVPLPLNIVRHDWIRGAGVTLAVVGILISALVVGSFRRAGTAVSPLHSTTRLVPTGPYRYSRNPDYIGQSILYVGITLILNVSWPLLMLPALILIIDHYVVRREERYLQAKFGDEYTQYRSRVRRWI